MPSGYRLPPPAPRPTAGAGTDRNTVLLVQNQAQLRTDLLAGLQGEGFTVVVAGGGVEGLEAFQAQRPRPAIVLLDLMLTGLTGLDLCRRLRAVSQVPIIVMAARSSELDTVVALEMGADDCVSRSCRLKELVARMRAALRRAPADDREEGPSSYTVGDVTLDLVRCEVTVADRTMNLPRKEFQVLRVLLEHPGRVFTRNTIMRRVWGEDYVGDTKTLDVHVRRIRSKVEEDPGLPRRLRTVRGLGFKFEAAGSAGAPPPGADFEVQGRSSVPAL